MIKKMTARAQVVRVADEALERKRAGETVSAIFDDLIERGEIRMALRSFSRWIGRFERDMAFVPTNATVAPSSMRDHNAASVPTHLAQPSRPRSHQAASPKNQPAGFKHARIGVALAPLPNMEPDRKALLGGDD